MMDDHRYCADKLALEQLLDAPLEQIVQIANNLKSKVDKLRGTNYTSALEMSDCIIRIGAALSQQELPSSANETVSQTRHQAGISIMALGTMARGDTLWMQGDAQAGWDTLNEAGDLHLSINNEVGWASTRIGKLYICNELQQVVQGEADALRAKEIFFNYKEYDKLVRLLNNLVAHHIRLNRFRDAIDVCDEAEEIITTKNLQNRRNILITKIMGNRATCYFYLGDMKKAEFYTQQSYELFMEEGSIYDAMDAKYNIAYNYQRQGYYREALDVFHQIQETYRELDDKSKYIRLIAFTYKAIGECYVALNRISEANASLTQALDLFRKSGIASQIAVTLTILGLCEIRQSHYEQAAIMLAEAEKIFDKPETKNNLGLIKLYQAILAFHQHNLDEGFELIDSAHEIFTTTEQLNDLAQVLLVWGELFLAKGDVDKTIQMGQKVLEIALIQEILPILFDAHSLLGLANIHKNNSFWAEKHFLSAMRVVEQLQNHLSLALRSHFFADKQISFHELIKLYLEADVEKALTILERGKAQLWQNYALNQNVLEWRITDDYGQELLDDLTELRKLRRVAEVESLEIDVSLLNAQILRKIEQLNIHCEQLLPMLPHNETLSRTIQSKLSPQTCLLEYYNDGHAWWVFVVYNTTIEAIKLDISVSDIEAMMGDFDAMIFDAITSSQETDPATQQQFLIDSYADWQDLLQEFYDALIRPVALQIELCELLIVVPYGDLHNIPFNLLHDGTKFLIENYELTLLPAANLLLRDYASRSDGASVIGFTQTHDSFVASQIETIAHMFDTTPYPIDTPIETILKESPRKVLHIAAHGEFNAIHPDLSFIELHNKHLYMFDIWQYDVSYELVVLSACETGRSQVYPGDEIIGLGASFLYKGVQSLVMSLWQVRSDWATDMMQDFYSRLLWQDSKTFLSKSKALQATQISFAEKKIHPLFWGAFQLIGDPRPLY